MPRARRRAGSASATRPRATKRSSTIWPSAPGGCRRLGDLVAAMNAQLERPAVLDRIAASLRELTRADAGGFVLIEDDRLRLVSLDGLPTRLRGRTADPASRTRGALIRSGKTVLMATGESGRFDDL